VNRYDLRRLLNDEVDCCFFRSVDNWFHARGAAMQTALSLIFRRYRGTSKSLVAELSAVECQRLHASVSSCDRYCGEWPTRELCNSITLHWYCILAITGCHTVLQLYFKRSWTLIRRARVYVWGALWVPLVESGTQPKPKSKSVYFTCIGAGIKSPTISKLVSFYAWHKLCCRMMYFPLSVRKSVCSLRYCVKTVKRIADPLNAWCFLQL